MLHPRLMSGWLWAVPLMFSTIQPSQGAEPNASPAPVLNSTAPPMLRGDTKNAHAGWVTNVLITVGEQNGANADLNEATLNHRFIGSPDGLGAYSSNAQQVRVLVNHEVGPTDGAKWTLQNGTVLRGARISYLDVSKSTRKVEAAGEAIKSIYDRAGTIVTAPTQLDNQGLGSFCSGTLYEAEQFGKGRGFATRIFLTNEEHNSAVGGTHWALDPATGDLWACPDLGRGAWENAALLDTGRADTVALLLMDDHGASSNPATFNNNPAPPVYLYVGKKLTTPNANFIERNGLKGGKLYAWKSDLNDFGPPTFRGTGTFRVGRWIPLTSNFDPAAVGNPTATHTTDGYAHDSTLRKEARTLGCCMFSRPEDVATNPLNGRQAVFASTGRFSLFGGVDTWGMIYVVDSTFAFDAQGMLNPSASPAVIRVLYDGNEAGKQNAGVRSPDNLTWTQTGKIYVQEDDSANFLAPYEASVWQLSATPKNSSTADATRILEIVRSSVPAGQTDNYVADVGHWESSGVIDVSALFPRFPGETLLMLDVQAHGLTGPIITAGELREGGQVLTASKLSLEQLIVDLINLFLKP